MNWSQSRTCAECNGIIESNSICSNCGLTQYRDSQSSHLANQFLLQSESLFIRGISDLEALMSVVFTDEHNSAPPCSSSFIAELKDEELTSIDLLSVQLIINGDRIKFAPSSFGATLIDLHSSKWNGIGIVNGDQVTFSCRLFTSNPACSPSSTCMALFSAESPPKAILFDRGETPFTQKALCAQDMAASLILVRQKGNTWPYTMVSSDPSGDLVKILAIMVPWDFKCECKEANHLTIKTEELTIACPICYEDFIVGSKIVRLPCKHIYHRECITQWLQKKNSCPLCRVSLPTDSKSYEMEHLDRPEERYSSLYL